MLTSGGGALYIRISSEKRPATCGAPLHHQVATQMVVIVAESAWVSGGRRKQEQPRCLDGVTGDHDGMGTLTVQHTGMQIFHTGGAPGVVVDEDAADVGVGTHLGTVGEGIGNVGDQWAGLGVDLAALDTEAR